MPSFESDTSKFQDELKLLNEIWAENRIRIIQFIGASRTGKTRLVRYWLDQAKPEYMIAWSFNSQEQVSAAPFFIQLFQLFNSSKYLETDFPSPEAKGEYLAKLLSRQRCVLVLDGLEFMQYANKNDRGKLKYRALRALLKSLVRDKKSMCIITTHLPVQELSDLGDVKNINFKRFEINYIKNILRKLILIDICGVFDYFQFTRLFYTVVLSIAVIIFSVFYLISPFVFLKVDKSFIAIKKEFVTLDEWTDCKACNNYEVRVSQYNRVMIPQNDSSKVDIFFKDDLYYFINCRLPSKSEISKLCKKSEQFCHRDTLQEFIRDAKKVTLYEKLEGTRDYYPFRYLCELY